MSNTNADVIIIGAGICGLMAAEKLAKSGAQVLVLEREPVVGGRLATIDLGAGCGDTGAQFFTAHLPEFQHIVDHWIEAGLVFEWATGFSDGSLVLLPTLSDYPRYAVSGGMRALPEYLASQIKDVRVNNAVISTAYAEKKWQVQTGDGATFTARVLLLTLPVPLALPLLTEGATDLAELDFDTLSAITYAPCLTGIFRLDGAAHLPQGGIQRHNSNLIWIGDNHQKGISPRAYILTAQAGGQYSAQMWETPEERVLQAMSAQLQPFLAGQATIQEARLIRWRYARPITTHRARCMTAAGGIPLVLAGDAFNGPRVEGAVLSGLAAANAIQALLKTGA